MDRRLFNSAGFGFFAGLGTLIATSANAAGDGKTGHKVVVQVSAGEPQIQALALGNAGNYAAYYKAKGEPFKIEIVAFGPGYQMVRADVSPVKDEIAKLQAKLGDALVISGCQNSRRGIAAREGKTPEDIVQLPGVIDTPSGIVRVAELQEQGWSYVRP
jgi:intracellular sulfur oxidation DsrE/DsrF family protein